MWPRYLREVQQWFIFIVTVVFFFDHSLHHFDCCRLQIASFHRQWLGLTWVVLEKLKRLCHAWKQTLEEEWRIRKRTMARAVQAGEMMVNIRVLTAKFPNRVISNSADSYAIKILFYLLILWLLSWQPCIHSPDSTQERKCGKRKSNKGWSRCFGESLLFYTFFKVWSIILSIGL